MKTMETNHESGNLNNNVTSVLLLASAWFMEFWRKITISDALSVLLQLLSILSVTLIVIINWPKAMKVISDARKNRKARKKEK